jgi:hypothetical protein
MNPFTEHPHQQGFTWWRHFRFAAGIACRLLPGALNLALHAVVPAIPMRKGWQLKELAEYLNERNAYVKRQATRSLEKT